MYCLNCSKEQETKIIEKEEVYPVKGEEITIQAQVKICAQCGEEIWDDELDAENLLRAFQIYRNRHGLLTPEQIQTIRKKYQLSQRSFSRVLGLGDKTITRYENGSLADSAQNNLIELMDNPSNFKILLMKNRDKITEQEYENAYKILSGLLEEPTKKAYTCQVGIFYSLDFERNQQRMRLEGEKCPRQAICDSITIQ